MQTGTNPDRRIVMESGSDRSAPGTGTCRDVDDVTGRREEVIA